jgi:hypothetical protein
MRVRLVWIERDFQGKELSKREEILCGESAKNPTRTHIARLTPRHHPQLQFAGKVLLVNASEEGHKWYVKQPSSTPTAGCTLMPYALDEKNVAQTDSQPDQGCSELPISFLENG